MKGDGGKSASAIQRWTAALNLQRYEIQEEYKRGIKPVSGILGAWGLAGKLCVHCPHFWTEATA